MAGGVCYGRIFKSRPKADRHAGLESPDSVATLARLRDLGDGAVVGSRSVWPLLIPASFVGFALADLQAGVPLRSIVWFVPGNTVEVFMRPRRLLLGPSV